MKRDSKYKFAKLLLLSSFSNVTAAQLEEVVVTAQKRAENVQDIPLAISAFGSDRLEKSGFDSISDLAMMSPSMQMGTFGPIAFVAMRGIGTENTTAGGDPGVALHYDGVYIGRPVGAIFAAFDSERVEILRGPQGTLYGRNATGGSINYVTKKPTDELGGEVDVTVGDYKWARVRGALNVPLTDSARARVVVFNEDRDGFTRNIVTGRDGNDADDFGVRGHLALDRLRPDLARTRTLLISATHIESKGVGSKPELREAFPGTTTRPVGAIGGPPGFAFDPMGPAGGIPAYNTYVDAQGNVAVNDLKPFENSKDFLESQDNDFSLVSANLEWEFGNLTFRSITGYGENSYESLQDEDFSSLDLAGFVIEEESEQISQEFQLV